MNNLNVLYSCRDEGSFPNFDTFPFNDKGTFLFPSTHKHDPRKCKKIKGSVS